MNRLVNVRGLRTVTDERWEPCLFHVQEPVARPELLEVRVDDVVLEPGATTWRYEAMGNVVEFAGETCARLRGSTAASPVLVELRVASVL